jgi:hypothetical protein
MPHDHALQPSATTPAAVPQQRSWSSTLLHGTLRLLLRPLLALGGLLGALLLGVVCLALLYGVPLLAAAVWIVYGLPLLLTWWIGPLHARPFVALCAWLGGGLMSGAFVFGCTQALGAGLLLRCPCLRTAPGLPASSPTAAPLWRRTIRRRVRLQSGAGGQTLEVVELEETIVEEQGLTPPAADPPGR